MFGIDKKKFNRDVRNAAKALGPKVTQRQSFLLGALWLADYLQKAVEKAGKK